MTDYSTWLTKQQAAAAIGCSTKTVEKLAQSRQLQQASRRSGTGAHVAVYHPEDVERIRQERNPEAPAFVLPAGAEAGGNGNSALVVAPRPVEELLRALLAAIQHVSENSQNGHVALSERLFLSVPEAAAVSGLSRAHLRRLIKAGELPTMKGARRCIRRRDLEAL